MRQPNTPMRAAHFIVLAALFTLAVSHGSGAQEAATAAAAPKGWGATLMQMLLNSMPLLLGVLTPWVTAGVKKGTEALGRSVPSPVLHGLNVVLGTAAATLAGLAGGVPLEMAGAQGAVASEVAWKLKNGPAVVEKPAPAEAPAPEAPAPTASRNGAPDA